MHSSISRRETKGKEKAENNKQEDPDDIFPFLDFFLSLSSPWLWDQTEGRFTCASANQFDSLSLPLDWKLADFPTSLCDCQLEPFSCIYLLVFFFYRLRFPLVLGHHFCRLASLFLYIYSSRLSLFYVFYGFLSVTGRGPSWRIQMDFTLPKSENPTLSKQASGSCSFPVFSPFSSQVSYVYAMCQMWCSSYARPKLRLALGWQKEADQ